MTSTTYLRAATAASLAVLAVLAVTAIAATRPATTVAGQATLDRARAAELTFRTRTCRSSGSPGTANPTRPGSSSTTEPSPAERK